MGLDNLGLFQLIARRLDWLTARQTALSENIANANTPGYRAIDVEPFARLIANRSAAPLAQAATQPGHLVGHAMGQPGAVPTQRAGDPYEIAPDGNQVAIEQQLMLMTQNAMEHQFATNIYRKQLGMIQLALGRAAR